MSYIQFESASKKEQARQELRAARDEMLEKAKINAEKRAERKAQDILSGKSTWILPSVASKFEKGKKSKKSKKSKQSKKVKKRRHEKSDSSDSDESDTNDSSSSEEKIRKKSKKSKKSKKKRKQEYSTSESSTENEDKEISECNKVIKWVEKSDTETNVKRDNWMMDSTAFSLMTFSKERNDQKLKETKSSETYDPAKSSRELNPHWKTTGTGLPEFKKPKDYSDGEENYKRPTAVNSNSRNWRKNTVASERSKDTRTRSISKSESSSEEDTEEEKKEDSFDSSEFLTDQQMNELGAKILKAEILGNMDQAKILKEKLEKARVQRAAVKDGAKNRKSVHRKEHRDKEDLVLLTHTDQQGNSRPLKSRKESLDPRDLYGGGKRNGRQKAASKRVETHVGGERVRFFPDDDKYDIKQMFEREKYATAADSNLQFANIASKHKNPNDDLDDIFADKVRKSVSQSDMDRKEMERAKNAHEKLAAQLENCDKCIESEKMNKSLIVAMGEKVYLALPWHIGLQPGHCVIVPTRHTTCSTNLDEDTWEEVEDFRKALVRMFAAQKKDVIFFEIANKLHHRTHLSINCVPIPMSQGEMAPFYFKKAIEESEHEWSVNKQLIRLRREKGLRSSIPKGLPYFWVHFGNDSGFAHVIEDENRFPNNFAMEIIGGMLHLDTSTWRKPKKEQNSITKVKLFADSWKKFDCTK